jgi:AraC-like DNA-binding protein
MESEKIYLDPSLKMDILAGKLSLSERSISNLLNRHVGKSFNDFVNGYRIEEAKRKLTDPASHQFTVAAIGFDCGFNSLATFQRCFKQFTGITPSQYQKFTPAEIVLKS